jgi:hypothetical protein
MRDFWKAVSEWNKHGLKEIWFPNYVFKPLVFNICFLAIVLMGLLIMNNHNWDFKDNFYYHCPESGEVCQNPFYNDGSVFQEDALECPINNPSFCNTAYFFPGYTIGEKIPSDVRTFPLFVFFVFLFGFVANHLVYNKRRIK